jgi:hypothetical protein
MWGGGVIPQGHTTRKSDSTGAYIEGMILQGQTTGTSGSTGEKYRRGQFTGAHNGESDFTGVLFLCPNPNSLKPEYLDTVKIIFPKKTSIMYFKF